MTCETQRVSVTEAVTSGGRAGLESLLPPHWPPAATDLSASVSPRDARSALLVLCAAYLFSLGFYHPPPHETTVWTGSKWRGHWKDTGKPSGSKGRENCWVSWETGNEDILGHSPLPPLIQLAASVYSSFTYPSPNLGDFSAQLSIFWLGQPFQYSSPKITREDSDHPTATPVLQLRVRHPAQLQSSRAGMETRITWPDVLPTSQGRGMGQSKKEWLDSVTASPVKHWVRTFSNPGQALKEKPQLFGWSIVSSKHC